MYSSKSLIGKSQRPDFLDVQSSGFGIFVLHLLPNGKMCECIGSQSFCSQVSQAELLRTGDSYRRLGLLTFAKIGLLHLNATQNDCDRLHHE